MIVSNSSPIILLAKQGMLDLMKKCFKKAVIPKSVYEEVSQKKGSPELIALEKAIKDKWVVVEKVNVIPALDTKNLGQGEKEAISLAVKHKSMLILDDDAAKKYSAIFGIEAHGVLYVIYLALIRKFIDDTDAMNALEGMIVDGFYISHDVYMRFFELLNSEKKKI